MRWRKLVARVRQASKVRRREQRKKERRDEAEQAFLEGEAGRPSYGVDSYLLGVATVDASSRFDKDDHPTGSLPTLAEERATMGSAEYPPGGSMWRPVFQLSPADGAPVFVGSEWEVVRLCRELGGHTGADMANERSAGLLDWLAGAMPGMVTRWRGVTITAVYPASLAMLGELETLIIDYWRS